MWTTTCGPKCTPPEKHLKRLNFFFFFRNHKVLPLLIICGHALSLWMCLGYELLRHVLGHKMKICISDLRWDWSVGAQLPNNWTEKWFFFFFLNWFLKKSGISFSTFENVLPVFTQCIHLWSYTLLLHIDVPHLLLSNTCLAYFAFCFILQYTWTLHSSHNSVPRAANHSQWLCLWSHFCVAATVIPCTTFKHVSFALQFVHSGIITTTHRRFPAFFTLLHPSGSVPSLLFSVPSRLTFWVYFFLLSIQFSFWQRSKVPTSESFLPLWRLVDFL